MSKCVVLQVEVEIKPSSMLGLYFGVYEDDRDTDSKIEIEKGSVAIKDNRNLTVFNTVIFKDGYLKEISVDTLTSVLDECLEIIVSTLKNYIDTIKLEDCLKGNRVIYSLANLYYKIKDASKDRRILRALELMADENKEEMALDILNNLH